LKKRGLVWRLYPSYLLVVALAIVTLGWYFLHNFESFQRERARAELERAADLLAEELRANSIPFDSAPAREICTRLGAAAGYRYTIIMPDGRVSADSKDEPGRMDRHTDRPEIRAALESGSGSSIRFSDTRDRVHIYVAVAVRDGGDLLGVVRASLLMEDLRTALAQMRRRLVLFSIVLMLLASAATVGATRQISRPLTEISRHSVALGEGDLKTRLPSSDISEIDAVAASINNMADRLNDRIATVERQRDEQNALFACMVEGVLAVDKQRRIIRMNAAARRFFQFKNGDPRGMMLSEVVRHSDLIAVIDRTLASSEIVEEDIFIAATSTHLQAHGSILTSGRGERIGAIVVLNDVTSLRKLEVMRKDFVANVSHELKTPITSIRGFLDTLIDTPDVEAEDRARFMQIVSQQVERLQSIVNDLLTFSNLEHEIGKGLVELRRTALKPVLVNSLQVCAKKAASRDIELKLINDLRLEAPLNAQLLEQALINLIDNAIKYSDEGTTIEIGAEQLGGEIHIRVMDQGMGIPAKHIERIFERFYCVDKSRSRKLGGTGLGLAIVKHVAIAHAGRVEVDSRPGQGSTFTIIIPA
jgi:two-component system, OmpR family, phosphate regulon sensor histidine kinase PhoR